MPINRVLQESSFDEDDLELLICAYEKALRKLSLKDPNAADPLTEMVAKKIVSIRESGVDDPAEISRLAIKELGL